MADLYNSRTSLSGTESVSNITANYRKFIQEKQLPDEYNVKNYYVYRTTGIDHMGRNVRVNGKSCFHFLKPDKKYLVCEIPHKNNRSIDSGKFLIMYQEIGCNFSFIALLDISLHKTDKNKRYINFTFDEVRYRNETVFKKHEVISMACEFDSNNTRTKYGKMHINSYGKKYNGSTHKAPDKVKVVRTNEGLFTEIDLKPQSKPTTRKTTKKKSNNNKSYKKY